MTVELDQLTPEQRAVVEQLEARGEPTGKTRHVLVLGGGIGKAALTAALTRVGQQMAIDAAQEPAPIVDMMPDAIELAVHIEKGRHEFQKNLRAFDQRPKPPKHNRAQHFRPRGRGR